MTFSQDHLTICGQVLTSASVLVHSSAGVVLEDGYVQTMLLFSLPHHACVFLSRRWGTSGRPYRWGCTRQSERCGPAGVRVQWDCAGEVMQGQLHRWECPWWASGHSGFLFWELLRHLSLFVLVTHCWKWKKSAFSEFGYHTQCLWNHILTDQLNKILWRIGKSSVSFHFRTSEIHFILAGKTVPRIEDLHIFWESKQS
jgi:hypothetical protein